MIEAPRSPQYRQAYAKAHKERAAAFAAIFKFLFKWNSVPLSAPAALTEPSR